MILELLKYYPRIHYFAVVLPEECCALAIYPAKSAQVTDYPEDIELHFSLRILAIEQEATEVLRPHPFSVGSEEVVNHKL